MSRLSERIENFNRAYSIYEIAVEKYKQNTKDILFHMSLVQAFELTFELSWKVLKDYILQKGIKAFYPKDVIKEAFANETIKDGELWIKMLETRNSISHEYKMEKVSAMVEDISDKYFKELKNFKEFLEQNIEQWLWFTR